MPSTVLSMAESSKPAAYTLSPLYTNAELWVQKGVITLKRIQRGFVINGESMDDFSGFSVSSAGDVNGDGLDDLIIGAHQADPSGELAAGKSYVVFGKTNSSTVNLSAMHHHECKHHK
jgi:hypothetical protein